MTYAPARLVDLSRYWDGQGGVPLGIVGNAAHTKGYHLGRDRIYDGAGPGLGDNDYSVQYARDRDGLTNAASAIDLGRLRGSLGELRRFSAWWVARCRTDPEVRRDVREIIYSPDGIRVQRYSGYDNAIHTGPGNGDSSHLTHTHVSFPRDSEYRPKVWMIAPYFQEDPVDIYSVPGLVAATWPAGSAIYRDPVGGSPAGTTSAAREYVLVGQSSGSDPKRYLVDGAGDEPSGRMGWLEASAATGMHDIADPAVIIAKRDLEWRQWLLAGSPGDL